MAVNAERWVAENAEREVAENAERGGAEDEEGGEEARTGLDRIMRPRFFLGPDRPGLRRPGENLARTGLAWTGTC